MTAQVPISQDTFLLPASFAQQRLWFLDRLEPDRAVYSVPAATRLRGPLDIGALSGALNALCDRHESLRTVFTIAEDLPHQVIHASGSLELTITDLCGQADAEERATALLSQRACEPFDLATGPLLRADLILLGPDDQILLLNAHHIIVDAMSMAVLNRELAALYGGFVDGVRTELPELPIQYGDYALWQQEWMVSGGLDAQLEYWSEHLAGAPTRLELPTDHPRPAQQSHRGATVRQMLPMSLLEQARALSERAGTTMFMTLLGVYAVLLSRYCGQEDVVVASPVANRNRVELENVVGLLVNTLALRVKLDGDPSFRDVLARVRETALGGFSNQELPFEKLVEELNPERHLSHAPIAQVLFVLHTAAERSANFPGVSQERIATERGTAKFDLSFFAAETAEGLRVSLEYCSDLFEEATALRMLEHYRVLLEAAVSDPECPVSRLGMLSEQERGLIVDEWNATEIGLPADTGRPVHGLVAAQAERTPDLVAVEFGEERLSYRELNVRANRLAWRLRELGVGPDVPVAIAAERSVEMVVGVLAALKAGGAYAPIDPHYPDERVAFMLADTNAPVVLTQRDLVEGLPAHGARTLCLDDEASYDPRETAPETGAGLDNLAYVIYTSGSTGQPKGVAMEHRPLANLLAWQRDCWAEHAPARTLQFASLSFDVAFQELFSTLSTGGTLILLNEEVRRDPEALLAYLAEQRVERLFLPFVALQNLCEAAEYLGVTVPALREVLTAGEQLKITDTIRQFFARHPDCTLVNQYGPTESHVITAFPLVGPVADWPPLPPIGQPIANAKNYVLDRHRQLVPIGVPGELHLGGVSLARGYLGRPDLTTDRFGPDPFTDDPEARLYRTGDLARWLPDGTIEYLGRTDHQVKIRGFRIEPGEIENALRDHPLITEALVVAREDSRGERQLVAYLIVHDRQLTTTELREFLRRTLPEYMVPTAFVTLTAFPLSPNGKVDRTALPAPEGTARETAEYAAPTDELERTLVEIWQELLGVERIGIHDNFFDLGGHSLLAVRLFSEVERLVKVRLPLVAIFRTGTIHGLANELRQGGHQVDQATVLELRSEGAGPAIYCLGGVHVYQELADELSPDYRCYGMYLPSEQEQFERESGAAHTDEASIEQIAAEYVEMIRDHQPEGPYLVFGLCFGGVVAYEAARQLTASGQEVRLLVLFDSVLAESVRNTAKLRVRRRIRRTRQALSNRVPERVNRWRGKLPRSEVDRMALARHRIYAKATQTYRPGPYDGPTILVRPSSVIETYRQNLIDDTSGWGRHARHLVIFEAPGDHITHLRRPHVRTVADELRPHLERLRSPVL